MAQAALIKGLLQIFAERIGTRRPPSCFRPRRSAAWRLPRSHQKSSIAGCAPYPSPPGAAGIKTPAHRPYAAGIWRKPQACTEPIVCTRECKGILCSSIIAFIIMRPSERVSGAQKGRPLLRPLPSALSGRRLRPLRCKAPDHRHSNTALRENVRRAVSSACTPAWKGPYLRYSRSSARAASTSRRSITSQALCT